MSTYVEGLQRHREKVARRASFEGRSGPLPTRTPEEYAAYKATKRAEWEAANPDKVQKPAPKKRAKKAVPA